MDDKAIKPASIAAQALGWIDDRTKAIALPIHPSTTYIRDPDNQYRSGRGYARADNPTFDQAEAVITALERGSASLLFASGMAAATAVFQALKPGDHVVAPKVMYWSLRNWLASFATQWGLQVEFVDAGDPAAIERAVRPGTTKLVWLETPANPLWTISDIAHAVRTRGNSVRIPRVSSHASNGPAIPPCCSRIVRMRCHSGESSRVVSVPATTSE